MSAGNPTISVVIPAYNSNATLASCLDALAAQKHPASDFEVIVVDNASDPPVRITRQFDFELRVVVETRPGSYAARNRGIALARGELIVFTDADCVPEPGWLAALHAYMRAHDDVDIAGGRIDLTFRKPGRPGLIELYDVATDAFPQKKYIEKNRFAITANLAVRRELFESLGLFDASLKSGGDGSWTRAAVDAGYGLAYCENAVVGHRARSGLREIARKKRRVVGGHIALRPDYRFRAKLVYAKIMSPFRLWKRMSRQGYPGKWERCTMMPILFWISANEIMEILLISLGKKPIRN